MFGRKKDVKKERRAKTDRNLEQLGIFEIPESLDDMGGQIEHDDIDDEDLEAELAALTMGDQPRRPARQKPAPKPAADLDKMISESMKDINSDEELSGDENDPDLLDELKFITGDEVEQPPTEVPNDTNETVNDTSETVNDTTKLLGERLVMYKLAVDKAKSENDSSKARRFTRGVKTLEQLLSSCKSGNEIDPSDIPPVLPASAIGPSAPKPAESAKPTADPVQEPPPSETVMDNPPADDQPATTDGASAINIDEEALNALKNRQKEYKIAALAWKKCGNHEEALNNIKITKQFDTVIAAVLKGDTIDLSDMPPAPTLPSQTSAGVSPSETEKEESENQNSADVSPNVPVSAPSATGDLGSALKERLEVYRRSKAVAETEGNSSKVRRYGRICKQFEDALKLHAKGRAIPIDELPTPPGFPPLSSLIGSASKPAPPPPAEVSEPTPETPKPSRHSPSKPATPVAPPRTNSDKKKKLTSRVDKQIEVLEKRKSELKTAALRAKKDGDLELARDYLRQAKGIDPLLNASLAGLPVDMNSIPLSPEAKLQLEGEDPIPANISDDGFTEITSMDCLEEASGTDQEIYENLEEQLKKQIKWCLTTRDYCKALGDVSNYNKWERLALNYKKDLDMLRVNKRNDLPPPKHHYEMKTYSIVQSCTDLADNDIEISIIRGINYPKEVDSYVMFEFPWPTDSPTSDRSSTIRGTNNPEYDATFPIAGIIDRKSRQCLRLFKRHSIKCQVWSKGSFLRADSLVGTVNIKLQPLETKCILHDSFPLMDGRKAVGGKLEVKIRLRNPISTKQIEQNRDKWLSIDH